MTYRQQYGKYDLCIDGMCIKWFTSYEKAYAEFSRLAKYPDELDGTLTLEVRSTGEILEIAEPVEE